MILMMQIVQHYYAELPIYCMLGDYRKNNVLSSTTPLIRPFIDNLVVMTVINELQTK